MKTVNFRRLICGVLLTAAMLGATSCSDDDDYYYPSVKLEMLTVTAGSDGTLSSVVTDNGERLAVSTDKTSLTLDGGTSKRVISNYEKLVDNTVCIYSLSSVVSPTPLPATDKTFEKGVKSDPLTVTSLWTGYEYINMLLTFKVDGSTTHYFHFVEESVGALEGGVKRISILLYHDSSEGESYYSRRAYASIPLKQYFETGCDTLRVTVANFNTDNVREERTVDYITNR
jgi:hypothetical protein